MRNIKHFRMQHFLITPVAYTEKKTDPKSRYFRMFESTFEKCLIQFSVELIQFDIAYDSLNYTENLLEISVKLTETELNFIICMVSPLIVAEYPGSSKYL